jgi:hypothetical protein
MGVAPVAMQQGRYVAAPSSPAARRAHATVPLHRQGQRRHDRARTGRRRPPWNPPQRVPAWVFWLALHLYYLIGFQNRWSCSPLGVQLRHARSQCAPDPRQRRERSPLVVGCPPGRRVPTAPVSSLAAMTAREPPDLDRSVLWHPFTQQQAGSTRTSRSSSRPTTRRSTTPRATPTSTASRRCGATSTATATRRSTSRSRTSSIASRTRRCSGSRTRRRQARQRLVDLAPEA